MVSDRTTLLLERLGGSSFQRVAWWLGTLTTGLLASTGAAAQAPTGTAVAFHHGPSVSFVTVDQGAGDRLDAKNNPSVGLSETFTVEAVGTGTNPNDVVRLKSEANGLYVMVDLMDSNTLKANGLDGQDRRAHFTWDSQANGIVRLVSSSNGKTVKVHGAAKSLRASSNQNGSETEFLWSAVPPGAGAGVRVATTEFSDTDVCVYSYNVVDDFGAAQDGVQDATAAFQAALDAADQAMGGTVYVPAGEYKITDRLILGTGVTLRGDWKKPTGKDRSVEGTILRICHGEGTTGGGAVELNRTATVRDLSFYYPDQSLNSVRAYPPTIKGGRGSTCACAFNITLVNAYRGIEFVRDDPATASTKMPMARQIYGTALDNGLHIHWTTSTPRVQDVHFGPDFWAGSDLDNPPTAAEITAALKAGGAKAFRWGDGDGGGTYCNLSARGYAVGIEVYMASSPRLMNVELLDCTTCIDFQETKEHAWTITGGTFDADSRAIRMWDGASSSTDKIAVHFNSCSFRSDDELIVHQWGRACFVNCDFESWGSGPAIDSTDADQIQVNGCTFGTPPEGGIHIKIGPSVTHGVVAHNVYAPSALISNGSTHSAMVVDLASQHDYAEPETTEVTFAPWPKPTGPSACVVHCVMTKGARGDGVTDDSDAFIAALAAAGSSGGGTVYIPPGIYKITKPLTVPSGVELRGCHGGPINPNGARCILLMYENLGSSAGAAFITLEERSGVNGFAILQPEQVARTTLPFDDAPPAIRSAGSHCWAANMLLSNAVRGIDFNFGDGHRVVGWLYAATLWGPNEQGYAVRIRSDAHLSSVENLQLKPDSWAEMRAVDWEGLAILNGLDAVSAAALEDSIRASFPSTEKERETVTQSGTGVIANGDGEFRFVAHFINRSMKSYIINGDPKIRIYMGGGEGPADGVIVNAPSGRLDMEEVSMTYHNKGIMGQYWIAPGGVAKVFNSKSYLSSTANSVRHMNGGGLLILQQDYRDDDLINGYCHANDGTTIIEGCYFKGAQNPRVEANGCGRAVFTGVSSRAALKFHDNDAGALTIGATAQPPEWMPNGPVNDPCDMKFMLVDCDVTSNSGGRTAKLSATGSRAVSDNDLSLTVSDLPPSGTTAYLFNAFLGPGQSLFTVPNPSPGGGPAAGGDVCIAGGTFGRHVFGGDVFVGTGGTFTISVDLTAVPSPRDGISFPAPGHYSTAILAGETWYWQCWYRDQAMGLGASNFSEAIAIRFL